MTKKPSPAERGGPFQVPTALFKLGQVVATPGALETCARPIVGLPCPSRARQLGLRGGR